jgi:hypothetical protein
MGREVRQVPPPDHPQDKEATWFQAWETVTEGTPVTPPFATTDELVDYLATPVGSQERRGVRQGGLGTDADRNRETDYHRATVAHCRTAPAVRVVVDSRRGGSP